MNIKTNNVPRDVIYGFDLTDTERAEFDYYDSQQALDNAAFFRYKGELYDLGEFERWDNPASPTRGAWDGVRSDTYFSGFVVRYVENCERVIVGTYFS